MKFEDLKVGMVVMTVSHFEGHEEVDIVKRRRIRTIEVISGKGIVFSNGTNVRGWDSFNPTDDGFVVKKHLTRIHYVVC
jgi:hypothetical protein